MSQDRPALKRLIQGDFFEAVQAVPDSSVNLVFADPPYFLSNDGFTVSSGKTASVNKGDWDKLPNGITTLEFHSNWIKEVRRVLHPDGALVVSGTYHSIYETGCAIQGAEFKILNEIIWLKPNGAPNLSGRRLAATHETLIWASKSNQSKFTFNYEQLKGGDFPGDKLKVPGRQMRSVWSIPTTPKVEKSHGKHPTQKPLALLDRVIVAFSNPGDVVLDPFMGSGTTGLSALSLQRSFIGIELEAAYYNLAKTRMGKFND